MGLDVWIMLGLTLPYLGVSFHSQFFFLYTLNEKRQKHRGFYILLYCVNFSYIQGIILKKKDFDAEHTTKN